MQGSLGEGSISIRGVRNASGRIIFLANLRRKRVRLSLTHHNFGQKGQNARLFLAIIKPAEWRFQWGGTFYVCDLFWLHSGQNRGPTVNFLVLFSRFRLISQARKVEMTHFKGPKSSTGCGQCREALGKGPTPSGGSGMHQEGSFFWRNCAKKWYTCL